jgi:hypothetical protein
MLTLTQLLDYLEFIRPGFRDEIRGASPLALRELEDASQAQLLPIHRELLLMMGEDMGPLTTGFVGADARIEVLLEHFRGGGWRPPARFSLLARDDEGGPMDTFLRWEKGMNEPEVVQFTIPGGQQAIVARGPEDFTRMAPSLPAWLYRCGFINFVGMRYANSVTADVHAPTQDIPARLDGLLRGRGFAPQHGGDSLTSAHWAQEAAVLWIRNHPSDEIILMIYADDLALIEDVRYMISTQVSARWGLVMPTQDEGELEVE